VCRLGLFGRTVLEYRVCFFSDFFGGGFGKLGVVMAFFWYFLVLRLEAVSRFSLCFPMHIQVAWYLVSDKHEMKREILEGKLCWFIDFAKRFRHSSFFFLAHLCFYHFAFPILCVSWLFRECNRDPVFCLHTAATKQIC
jgi:hypothetical protein